ncbi:hypothetical protein H0O02_03425 [Candidatus Micrarchaeota archaeon]|nr:hypothetical protein [Candidatus Micrarchaeota archaeon]
MHRMYFRLKYPKLILFLVSIIIGFLIFKEASVDGVHEYLLAIGYFGIFLAGFFYVYGLTSVPATVLLLILAKDQNLFPAVLAASLGALLADIILFMFVRYEFKDEINKLPTKKFFKSKDKSLPHRIEKFLYMVAAAFLIGSPLPTEIGITMMASVTEMSAKKFAIIAYLLHTAAIALILMAGRMI